MILLHLAHRGEAQHFLSHLTLSASQSDFPGVYCNMNSGILLLIAGEGLTPTHNKISYLLGKYPITKVINLGIAGVLDTKVELDQIVSITTSYAFSNKPEFHSYSTHLGPHITKTSTVYSCISTTERVLDSTLANKLAPFAQIVDRELWALASSCATFNIPFESYKYLSDYAGINTQCLDIKNRASEFSQRLLEFYLENSIQKTESNSIPEIQLPKNYHFTFTQKHQVTKLLRNLACKWDIEVDTVLEKIDLTYQEVLEKNEKLRAKEKTLKFITLLEDALNPLRSQITKKLQACVSPFKEAGANIFFDNQLEKKEFQLRIDINSQTNIDKLQKALSLFNFASFCDIMDGNIDLNIEEDSDV